MIFKNQLKRGNALLNRGDRCLFRSVEARYLGSFKNKDDVHWNHMLLVQQNMTGNLTTIEEFIITTQDTRDICFKAMMPENVEGQLTLC